MALSRRARDEMLAHCDEIHADDGVDPRELFRDSRSSTKVDRKALQLCRQVAETLDQILTGEIRDEQLAGLQVLGVVPAPDASRLLVTLAASEANGRDRQQVEARLAACSGWLRTEIAAAITRRKAPSLAFQLVDPGISATAEAQREREGKS